MKMMKKNNNKEKIKLKIYTDDKLVKYVDSDVSPERTKDQISAKLVEYHVADIAWHWKPENYDVFVQFGIEEIINDVPVRVAARVVCPVVWHKANPRAKNREDRVEHVDLRTSMRVMYWYIKSHLESAYASQSSMVAGFLSDIVTQSDRTYFDTIVGRITEFAALPEPTEKAAPKNVEVVHRDRINVTNQ